MRGSSSTQPWSAVRITSWMVALTLTLAAAGFNAITPVSAATRAASVPLRASHVGRIASDRSLHAESFKTSGAGRVTGAGPAPGARMPLSPAPLSPSSCNSTWSIVASPNGAGDNGLNATAATSGSDLWAVGNWTSGSGSTVVDRTLAEHWNGSSWSITPTGNVGNYGNDLNAVAAISPTNAWAVGEYTDHFVSNGTTFDIFQTLIEHWDGTTWTIMPSVDQIPPMYSEADNTLLGVTALGANDVWAVGTYYTGTTDQALALHYNGSSWSVVLPVNSGTGDNMLFSVSGSAGNDVWATGFFRAAGSGDPPAGNGSPRQTLTVHWNGVAWAVVSSPSVNSMGDGNLYSVAALSATNAWAAGYGRVNNTSLRQTLIEHYDGTAWTITTSTNPAAGDNVLFGIAMLGATDGWVVGYDKANTSASTPAQTLTEQWNGTAWGTVASADTGPVNNALYAVTGISASDVWATGFAASGAPPNQILTENFCTPATVTGISPTKGPTSGGTSVTITGTGFVLANGVMFGSLAANGFSINSDTQITAKSPAAVAGQVDVKVTYFGGASATNPVDQFTFIPLYVFSPQPIAPNATLAANQSVPVTLTAKSFDGTPVGGATIYLSSVQSAGAATAKVGSTALNTIPTAYSADSSGNIAITYTTPPTVLPTVGTDTIIAQDSSSSPAVTAQDTYMYSKGTTFYFAEGFTGSGFTETLSMLMPNQTGTGSIDYYTETGHQPTVVVNLTAGQVLIEDVNADVGAGHQVSAVVSLPGPGVAERALHFNNGTWHGSTDKVGVTGPATEWDFAEGSTLTIFAEFLSLQNPNPYSVVVDLNYATDSGAHPTRTVVLPANSRITIGVGYGNLTVAPPPLLNYGGCDPLHTCGVGGGLIGVSVQVKSRTLPIVAERPFYVMSYSFGSGTIKDGHDAFGANRPATTWNFAEGNTLNGFNEYLTIQNPGSTAANVRLHYIYDLGTKDVNLVVNAQSRQTALVFDAGHFGIGKGYVGVSVVITSDQPIVAERPMYMYYNFGTGPVAGAHVVVGATSLNRVFGFANASTLSGDNDYLTIQNSNSVTANLVITYYESTGPPVVKNVAVPNNSRHTVLIFGSTEGVGSGVAPLGITVSSDQPVQVERPTYSSTSSTYGATDTSGYTPPTGGF